MYKKRKLIILGVSLLIFAVFLSGCSEEVNKAPVIESLNKSTSGLTATITGSVKDSDGTVKEVSIDWGDGNTTTIDSGFDSIDESYTYNSSGDYEITITAIDDDGAEVSKSLTVNVNKPNYTLTIDTQGEGSVNPKEGSHEFEEGKEVSLEANSADGWKFDHWKGDYPTGYSNNKNITITMDGNKNLTAIFNEIPESVIYTGNGDDVIDIERPGGQENFLIYIEGNQSKGHFAVKGLDSFGNTTDLYANTTKYYKGLNLSKTDYYTLPTEKLEITASTDDKWLIEIRPIEKVETISPQGTYSNEGDYVFKIDSSINSITIKGNQEENHFAVMSHDGIFDDYELLVNTTDYYEGKVSVSYDMEYFEVTAKGEWSFEF